MKKVILLWMASAFLACNNLEYQAPKVGSYTNGADISWVTEQEKEGILFYDSLGQATECMLLLRNYGMDAVRLRVWVNPTNGYCNKEDVLVKAKRAHALHLRLMIDFHYSNWWADPSKQYAPKEWENMSLPDMQQALANHTIEVLTALRNEGIEPEWVQVGNETRSGMCWPLGKLYDTEGKETTSGWHNYAMLTAAGYDAVKSVFPKTTVIVHIDNAYQSNNWFFRRLHQEGGKWDMIGLSHYPMQKEWSGKDWQEMNILAADNIRALYNEFRCPIMIVEIGTIDTQVSTATTAIRDFKERIKDYDFLKGIFYWEPQCYNRWQGYNMGAFTYAGMPNAALIELWKK